MENPAGLIVLIAAPAVVVLYGYRRRLPVRRVAAVFLWGTPRVVRRSSARFSLRPTWPLARDLVAVLLFAALAAGLHFRGASMSGEFEPRMGAAFRIVLCLAVATLVAWNWRRAGAATRDQSPAALAAPAATDSPNER